MSNLQTKIEVLSKKLEDINSLADKYFEENFKDKEIKIDNSRIYFRVWGTEYEVTGLTNYLLYGEDSYDSISSIEFKDLEDTSDKIEILKLLCKNSIS
jgi:hypothetical protein